jgi:magnesium transporter
VRNYLRNVKDHLKQMASEIGHYHERLGHILIDCKQARDKKQADVQFTISVVAALFLPATFMTGLYGMNFDNMPELQSKYGYYIWWFVLACTTISILAYLKFVKHWI